MTSRALQTERTVEGYLTAGAPPRWMERAMQVENGLRRARRELTESRARLLAEDPSGASWRSYAERVRFDDLNALIRSHNRFYPMERDLPMDPRTGDYVLVHGRDFRRPEITPAWILTELPG